MKQISLYGRLILRRILTGLSLGLVAFVFQACYGAPPATYRGKVTNAGTDKPISGIKVSVSENEGDYDITGSDGQFMLYGYNTSQNTDLLFEDIDGFENGKFRDKKITLDLNSRKKGDLLTVTLDEK